MKRFFLLAIILLLAVSIHSQAESKYVIFDTKTGEKLSIEQLASSAIKSEVVFFGEFHDDSLNHYLQMEFIKEFHRLNPKMAISMEMFERDAQPQVNSYLAGTIDDEEFQKASRPWPDYKQFYRQFIEFAKDKKLDVVAGNIPRKYAAMYAQSARTELKKLPAEEQAMFAQKLVLGNDKYLTNFFETMLGSVEKVASLTPNQENTIYLYYGAQCIKDETMAESILEYHRSNPDMKIIHLNGNFHSSEYLGTAQKLIQRDNKIKSSVISMAYYTDYDKIEFSKDLQNSGDYVIYLPEIEREAQSMRGSHFGENSASEHNIKVSINPETSELSGEDKIIFKSPILKSASVKLLNTLDVIDVSSSQKITYIIKKSDDYYNEIIISNPSLETQSYSNDGIAEFNDITIKYKGKVNFAPSEISLTKRHSNTPGIISGKEAEGIYLPGGSFYPQSDKDLAVFNAEITIPQDFTIVSSGTVEKNQKAGNSIFKINTPQLDDLTIVGGRYKSIVKQHDGVEFAIHTLRDNPNAEKYLDESIKYYDYYVPLFGDYPYKTFSIVENFFATGFGMPGYTLLSDKLTAMPWVLLSPGSLAHEFVHNWWGNSVLIDHDYGNWCEGLTAFSTNYYLNILKGSEDEARTWRQKSLLAIDALPAEKNYPVNDFKYQSNTYDAVIGYEKSAFVFQEVLKLIGKDNLFGALKSFATKYKGRRAYWMNLIGEISNRTNDTMKIKSIMNSWIKSKDIPALSLTYATFANDSITFDISSSSNRTMAIPVFIENADKTVNKQYLIINDSINRLAIYSKSKPLSLTIDSDFETLRQLNSHEKPFNFNRTLDADPTLVLPAKTSSDYAISMAYIEILKESGYDFKTINSNDLKESDTKDKSLILLGNSANNPWIAKLAKQLPDSLALGNDAFSYNGNSAKLGEHILLANVEHPFNADKLCTMIVFDGLKDVSPLNRLSHYRGYSLVLLNLGRSGRPSYTQEILPKTSGNNPQKWVFK